MTTDEANKALVQPELQGPKPAPDYGRVPEIATEAQIRSAAQYLVKKQGCDIAAPMARARAELAPPSSRCR